jgi:hypothetical protein
MDHTNEHSRRSKPQTGALDVLDARVAERGIDQEHYA